MKSKSKLLLALAVLVGAIACQPYPPDGDENTNTNTNNINIFVPGDAPGDGTGPGRENVAALSLEDVGQETCPQGLSPATGYREVRIGCTAMLTCSPLDKDGLKLPKEKHPTAPDQFAIVTGEAEFRQDDNEKWNAHTKPGGTGSSSYVCALGSISKALTLTHVP